MRKILSGRRSPSRGDFIMRVNTNTQTLYGGQTPSGTDQFYFPIVNGTDTYGYSINFTIDWGDGSSSQVNPSNYATACLHTYTSPGTYTIKARGNIAGFNFWAMINSPGKADGLKLVEIQKWGDLKLTGGVSSGQMFRNCDNLTSISADDAPWFPLGTFGSLNSRGGRGTFSGCGGLTVINNIAKWDVSRCDTLEIMFSGCAKFQFGTNAFGGIDLSAWDVGQCFRFERMFFNCSAFNAKMFGNVGAATGTSSIDFQMMFRNCPDFDNQNSGTMNDWDTQYATDMDYMFYGATLFNDDITSWDTGNVTAMREMFSGATNFNQNISSWDVSSVTDMRGIFTNAAAFNQPIGLWNVNAWSAYSIGQRPLESSSGSTFNLSTTNYDNLLVAWDAYNFPNWPGGIVDFGSSQYSLISPGNQVSLARTSLVNKWGAINDGGGI